ncbi:MAG: response regulator [Gammaproteobacteria bacterium]|nr:response regulator [Gammaproteobacteria bacterium]
MLQIEEWEDALRVFEHFRDLPDAVRIGDLPSWLRSSGFLPIAIPSRALQATPIRYRGVYAGSVFLVGKDGDREFTREDEEVLVLLAAQAATAIANARTFRDEQRARAKFLGIVTHELRAPLAAIKGSSTTVLAASRRFSSAEMLQFFRIIDEQADNMSVLMGDLLDAGRIATGTLSIWSEASDVGALIDRARNTFLSAGGPHGVRVDIPPDLPSVLVDRQRIVQVLGNLLSNAANHAQASSPIEVSARRDGVHVAISVSDNGKGIPPERLARLFSGRAGAGDGKRGVATGLGLAICKGLVEAHGGRIWAESEGEDRGARFTFTVPVAEEAGGDVTAQESYARHRSHRGGEATRILVVDDDPQALLFIRDALTTAGYAVLETGEPRELSSIIRAERPRLVLLDLMLPGTDGIRLMEQVPDLADLPVIFISAYARDETIAKAFEAGAADYIVKPFSATELTARIRAALRRRAEPAAFVLRELAIDYDRRRVTLGGEPLELTATEYELLRVLSANPGRVLTYRALLRLAWGTRYRGSVNPRLVHAVVKRLRDKLGEDGARPAYIINERRVGYRMPAPGDRATGPA